MKKALMICFAVALAASMTGCHLVSSSTNLADVANTHQLSNVTTGDGTFENYKAMGHYNAVEFGVAIGIPFLFKIIELIPAASNEDLLGDIAKAAKDDGATAMINVTPHEEWYTGFPFFIVGLYFDRAEGTGIKVGK